MFEGAPDMFHVRYFWKDGIDFEVLNPDESCAAGWQTTLMMDLVMFTRTMPGLAGEDGAFESFGTTIVGPAGNLLTCLVF